MATHVIQFPSRDEYARAVIALREVPRTRVGLPDFKMVVEDDHVKALDRSGIPYTDITKDARKAPPPSSQRAGTDEGIAADGGRIMPVHDWTRVSAGTFHDFHSGWIIELRNALNAGLLPRPYYAMAEQVAGSVGPDVLTLQGNGSGGDAPQMGERGPTAVAVAPPKVRFTATAERDQYAKKQRTLVIRHGSDDRIVALIEILSPGNKGSRHALHTFVEKAVGVLAGGYHLLLIDLLPPGPRDPQGIHGAVWAEIGDDAYTQPPDKPLTLASYKAGEANTVYYVEPVAVGDVLIDMPLFLTPAEYVSVPLEATYMAAWRGLGWRWQAVLEGQP